jgi:hypothetical protein
MKTKVHRPLELAEIVVNHLDAVALDSLIGGKGAVRSPGKGARVGDARCNVSDDLAIGWAAFEEDKSNRVAHASAIPDNRERLSDGRVGRGVRGGNRVVGELSLRYTLGFILILALKYTYGVGASSRSCGNAGSGNNGGLGQHVCLFVLRR